jgi:hypothetical protein
MTLTKTGLSAVRTFSPLGVIIDKLLSTTQTLGAKIHKKMLSCRCFGGR